MISNCSFIYHFSHNKTLRSYQSQRVNLTILTLLWRLSVLKINSHYKKEKEMMMMMMMIAC